MLIIKLSGLLRSARNDGDLYRHRSFLQRIFPMPGARNDGTCSSEGYENFTLKKTAFGVG